MTDFVEPEPVTPDQQAFVRFDGNCYSVRPSADRVLRLVADDRTVRLVDGTETVVNGSVSPSNSAGRRRSAG